MNRGADSIGEVEIVVWVQQIAVSLLYAWSGRRQ